MLRPLPVLQRPGPVRIQGNAPDDVAEEAMGRSHGNNHGLIQMHFLLSAAVNHSVTSNHESLILDFRFSR